jgi:hypothetical protein
MKAHLSNLIFGTDNLLSGFIALAFVLAVALGCTCGKNFDLANLGKNSNTASNSANASTDSDDDAATGDMPGDELLNALVKETTADFAYAISTEDFSQMYEKASRDLQSQYSAEQMKDVFKSEIKNKKRLLPILAKLVSMKPTYSPDPYIRTEAGNSILVVNGTYDVKPQALDFEYEYVKRNGQFKLLKLVLK